MGQTAPLRDRMDRSSEHSHVHSLANDTKTAENVAMNVGTQRTKLKNESSPIALKIKLPERCWRAPSPLDNPGVDAAPDAVEGARRRSIRRTSSAWGFQHVHGRLAKSRTCEVYVHGERSLYERRNLHRFMEEALDVVHHYEGGRRARYHDDREEIL